MVKKKKEKKTGSLSRLSTIFHQIKKEKSLDSRLPFSLYIYFCTFPQVNVGKYNFLVTFREYLLLCVETNFSDRDNIFIPFHLTSSSYKYRALIHATICCEVCFCQGVVRQQAKFTAEARHTLATVSLNKENFDTCNKGKPFHELLLYWNLAQQMQFKWKGNFCCCL